MKSLRPHLSTSDLAQLFADGGRSTGPSPLPRAENDATAIDFTIDMLARPAT
ncbi:hypothetical protein [Nonomuraea sp. NPDC048826]|uniref:hypothetical protein n=1 Tax=Nonomuraea sp. NPDC048826 TaxID=3364347 RepID=UPI00371E76A4